MTAQIIDGKAIAEQIREEIKADVERLAASGPVHEGRRVWTRVG